MEDHPLQGQEDRVSVYRVTDLIGTSAQSWEDAEDGGITYRTKLRVSFKYEAGE